MSDAELWTVLAGMTGLVTVNTIVLMAVIKTKFDGLERSMSAHIAYLDRQKIGDSRREQS